MDANALTQALTDASTALGKAAAAVKVADTTTTPPVTTPPVTTTPAVKGPLGGPTTMTLKFEDTFDTKPTLDLAKWRKGFWWGAAGNHHGAGFEKGNAAKSEAQWYDPAQVAITNGLLRMTAIKGVTDKSADEGIVYQYKSGIVTTADDYYGVTLDASLPWPRQPQPPTFDFQFGWAEARLKCSKGKGLWPAFWLLPTDHTWPPEIDALELLMDVPNKAYMTYHYGQDPNHPQSGFNSTVVDWSTDFHVIGVHWEPGKITWFIDGKQVAQTTTGVTDKRCYLLLNLAVGSSGIWPGSPDANTQFPAYLDVDWVRVWQ